MLNDNQIEKYLYKYVKRQNEFVLAVLSITAKRIRDNNHINSLNTMFSMKEMLKQSQDITHIRNAEDELRKKQLSSLYDDLLAIALLTYNELRDLYTVPIMYKANEELTKEIDKVIEESVKNLKDLISKPVFIISNKSYSPENAYKLATQDAILRNALSGPVKSTRNALNRLYDAPFKFSIKDTSNSDKRIVDATNTLRMGVLNGIKNIFQTVNNVVAKQTKSDGIELSAHICPAPDHAPAQGHQFSNEEFDKMQSGQDFVDVNGNHYTGFVRQIGEWNCRHYVKPIKIGITVPEHSQKELDKILEDNQKGYTTKDGKHYTLYECTQVQREYERNIRENKERCIVARNSEDSVSEKKYKGKVATLTNQYKAFSSACGLPIQSERIKVKDY